MKESCPSGSQPFELVGVPEQALGGFPWVWIDFWGITFLKFHEPRMFGIVVLTSASGE